MPSEAPPKKTSHVAKHIVKGVDMAIGSTLSVGLIGEYVGRIYISMNNSPQYVIRERIGLGTDEDPQV